MWGNATNATVTTTEIYQVTGSGNPGAYPWPTPAANWIEYEAPEPEEDVATTARQAALDRSRAVVRAALVRNAEPIDRDDVAPPRPAPAPRRRAIRSSARGVRNWRRRA